MPQDINKRKDDQKSQIVVKNGWMIRGCEVYDDEYSDCCSIKARFNQYFIHGKTVDCSQWKRDSINCYKWLDNKDIKAANELVQSEKNRKNARFQPHYANSVWKRRTTPPESWNKPLPEHMQKEYENSYLHIKAKEMRGEVSPGFDIYSNLSCSLM